MVPAPFRALFSCARIMKKQTLQGPLPSDREVYQTTFRIAWPSIVESILVALISAVDTMMVGGIGPEAITAVGITGQPRMILIAVIMSLNVGVTAVVARRKGADDLDGANRCLKQCVMLSIGCSLVLSVLGLACARPLMIDRLFQAFVNALLLNQHMSSGNMGVNEAGMVQVELFFKNDELLRIFHIVHIPKQGKPEGLALPFFVSLPLPLCGEFFGCLLLFPVCHLITRLPLFAGVAAVGFIIPDFSAGCKQVEHLFAPYRW